MKTNPHVQRVHHITLNVGTPQEDYDFHTKVLGMKSVKKTALYDGDEPVFHLYYGNDRAQESSLVTTFPMRQSGRKARPGSGTIATLALSVPPASLGFWEQRLKAHAVDVKVTERFGERLLMCSHPCGIAYELVGVEKDSRPAFSTGPVPQEFGIRGIHGITVSAKDLPNTEEFLSEGWTGKKRNTEARYSRWEVGEGGTAAIIDVRHDPDVVQGSWAYGEGVAHHCAFQVSDLGVQTWVKSHLEGLGYTDVSDRKDRGYFDSVYVRTPSGPLFEAAVSKQTGFTIDEPFEKLGTSLQIPPVFMSRKDALVKHLGPLPVD
jgi:glyoxalase family protein